MCTKVIKEYQYGLKYLRVCQKPDFKDGLCQYHYRRAKEKSTVWGERPDYREATLKEFTMGRSVKLKHENAHHIYRFRNNTIQKYSPKRDAWENTDLMLPYTSFCIKYIP